MIEQEAELFVAGVSYRKTALTVRNKFALTTENIRHIYQDLDRNSPADFFILSTCNRTEIYSITKHPRQLVDLFSHYSHAEKEEIKNGIFIKSGDEAVKHLFSVAAGLDSQILGDHEIIAQLKSAFALSKSNNCTSGLMEKLVNVSLQASRQIRSRTSISNGTTSISYAVIQLLKQETSDRIPTNICLMGLGKIGMLTLKNLKYYLHQHQVTLLNRNESKAWSAAEEYGVSYDTMEQQNEVLRNSDVLIVATGADHPVITKQQVESSNIKLIFDLSVPSNVAEDVKEIEGVKIYDIDGLSQIVNKTIEQRENQIPLAEEIIEEHFLEFKEWERKRDLYKVKVEV